MGIRGLETFVDSLHKDKVTRDRVFETLKLSDLKLVIDGNQFNHFVSSVFGLGAYGGQYDQFYQKLKQLLLILKDSIEIVLFDGGKENNAN